MRIDGRAMLLGAKVAAPLLALACAGETQSSNPAAAKGGALGQGGVAAVGAGGIVPGASGGASPLGGSGATAQAGTASAAGGVTAVCSAGDTRVCVGPGACAGGQLCALDGHWLACDCGVTSPVAGGGQSSGASGSTSSGSTSSGSTSGVGGANSGTGGRAGTAGTVNSTAAGTTSTGRIACGNATVSIPATASCTPSIAATGQLANVALMIDRSGSMASIPLGYSESKWAALRSAVAQTVTDFGEAQLGLGLQLFPYLSSDSVTSCELTEATGNLVVNVDRIAVAGQTIVAAMASIVPMGGTPTATALALALDYFTMGKGADLRGEKALLLVTDGGPNCSADVVCGPETCTANMDKSGSCGTGIYNCCDLALSVAGRPNPQTLCLDDMSVTSRLMALASAGIKTYVVGLPGSEAYATYFDSFAVAGGTALASGSRKYYAVTSADASGIVNALEAVLLRTTQSCTISLSAALTNSERSQLLVECALVPRQDATGQAQWTYNGDPIDPAITLLGSTCTKVQAAGVRRVEVVDVCAAN